MDETETACSTRNYNEEELRASEIQDPLHVIARHCHWMPHAGTCAQVD